MRQQEREKRKNFRYPGQTLMLEVNGCVQPFIDISTGGLSFEGEGFIPGQMLNVRISSVLDSADTITAPCRVANVCGHRVGVSFAALNFQLFEYVIAHIANVTAISPFVIKRTIGR